METATPISSSYHPAARRDTRDIGLFTSGDLARAFKVDPQVIRRAIRIQGVEPVGMVGHTWVYNKFAYDAVKQYVERQAARRAARASKSESNK